MSIYNSYKTNILKPASVLILHMKNETISGNYHKIHSLGHRFHFYTETGLCFNFAHEK